MMENPKDGITVPIIVSMTSYPRRFGVCSEVIRRILSARVKPEKIFLAIYKDEMNQLTDELRRMQSDGLIEIFPTPIDVRPHNKYVWSMLKYKDKPIITLDDDVAYEPDIVERLYEGYLSHQDSVCAIRFHQMTFDQNGRINNYMKWKFEVDELKTNFVVATGVSGVLYPPNFLSGIPTELLELAITKHITTDDIVLTWIRLKKGIKAFLVPSNIKLPPSLDRNNGLCLHENRGGVKNDMCVRDIIQPLLTK